MLIRITPEAQNQVRCRKIKLTNLDPVNTTSDKLIRDAITNSQF